MTKIYKQLQRRKTRTFLTNENGPSETKRNVIDFVIGTDISALSLSVGTYFVRDMTNTILFYIDVKGPLAVLNVTPALLVRDVVADLETLTVSVDMPAQGMTDDIFSNLLHNLALRTVNIFTTRARERGLIDS